MKHKKMKSHSQKSFFLSLGVFLILMVFLWAQENITEAPQLEYGQSTALYSNQTRHDLRQAFCGAISQAEQSIMLIIYGLTDPYVIDSLNKKAQEGVPVHVVCDAKASPHIDSKLDPKISIVRRFGPGLMHQKLLVIDDRQVWMGSANLTADSLRMHGNLVTAVESPMLANVVNAKGISLDAEDRTASIPHETFNINGQSMEMWFLPDDQKKAIARVKELIASAEKTIKIAMFTWTRFDFAHALIAAQKRGVKTEVVIDRASSKGASAKVAKLLKKGGVPTAVSRGGDALLHHKFAYIDGKTLVNGSANWTKAAFAQNDDFFIVLHDLTEEQNQEMESLWNVIKTESKGL